jgi:hypothetical protein
MDRFHQNRGDQGVSLHSEMAGQVLRLSLEFIMALLSAKIISFISRNLRKQ